MARLVRTSEGLLFIAVLIMASLLAAARNTAGQPAASQPATSSSAQASSKPSQSSPSSQPAASKTGGTIKIGAALSATGPIANEGSLMKKGYDLWKDTVNSKGGIDVGGAKYKVEIVYYDDKGDATTGGKLIEKLITEDKVDFIFGPFGSGMSQSTSAISEKYQKVMIAPTANADAVYARGFKYLFGILPPVTEGFGQHIDYIATLQPKLGKLGVIFPDDLYPSAAAEVVKKKAEAINLPVGFFQKYPKGASDIAAVVSELKASGVDGVLIPGYLADYVLFMKTAKEMKANFKYIGGMGVPSDDFVKAIGKDAEYTFDAPWWLPVSGWKGPVFGSSEDFNTLFKKTYNNEEATYFSSSAANAGLILQLAMEKAGSVDPEKVRAALSAIDVETFAGSVKYDATGFNRAGKGLIIQIRNGKTEVAFPSKLVKDKPVYPIPDWDKR